MFKLGMAGASVIVGLTLAAYQLYHGHFIYVLFFVLCGLTVGWAWLNEVPEVFFEPSYLGANAVIGLVGAFGMFYYSDATKLNLQAGYSNALIGMTELTQTCHPMSPEIRKLQEQGVRACASQNNSDTFDLVSDLHKGNELGAGLSLLDGAHDTIKDPHVNRCAQAFKAAYTHCPYSFHSVSEEERDALLKAADY